MRRARVINYFADVKPGQLKRLTTFFRYILFSVYFYERVSVNRCRCFIGYVYVFFVFIIRYLVAKRNTENFDLYLYRKTTKNVKKTLIRL